MASHMCNQFWKEGHSHPSCVCHSNQGEKGFHQWEIPTSTSEFSIWYGTSTNLIAPDEDIDAARGVGLHARSAGANIMLLKMFQDMAQAI